MKFIAIGDSHLDKRTYSRIDYDTYEQTQIEKINETKDIANKEHAKAILQTGDFLDKAVIKPEQIASIIEKWQYGDINYNEIINEIAYGNKTIDDLVKAVKTGKSMPIIGVKGNHELIGGEVSTYKKTSLYNLVKSNLITLVDNNNPIIFKDESGFTVAITGSDYTHNIDGDDKSAYIVKEKLADFHIHIVHGMLMPKSYGKKFKHTVISDIAYETKADLTINGHDHLGYDVQEIDGKLFVNPGAILRLTADKREMERMPKILIIDITKENGIQVKTHYLECAKPGDEVLTRDHILRAKEKSDELEDIESLISKANLGKGIDITEIIKEVSDSKGIDENIKNHVIELVVDKMRSLDVPFNPKGEYIIEAVQLENYLCHKDTYLELSKGLNVFCGESRNGKSTVLRAIREVFECYMTNPRNNIFYNEDYFKITLFLSNGFIISRIVEKKESGKNGYEIFDPSTGETNYHNTKALSMVQEILGYNKIKLSEKNKVDINFLNQGEGWFFVGKGLSAPDKAKLTGIVYGTHYADAVLKDVNSQSKKIVTDINFQTKEIKKLEENTKKYNYLDEYSKVIYEVEKMYEEINKAQESLDRAKTLLEEKNKILTELNSLDYIISNVNKNKKKYTELYEEIEKDLATINSGKQKNLELKTILKAGVEAKFIENKLANVGKSSILVSEIIKLEAELKVNKEKLKKHNELTKESNALLNQIKNTEIISNNLKDISIANSIIKDAKELYNTQEKAKRIYKEIKVLNKDIEEAQNSEKLYAEETLKYISDYKQILDEMGECPICRANIDAKIIDSIIYDLKKNI